MKISAVVPQYRRPELLPSCLGALEAGLARHDHEIIVVDNDEPPNGLVAAACNRSAAKHIRPGCNTFLGTAVNVASDYATGDILLIVHNDVIVAGDFMGRMLAAAEAHGATMVGGVVEDGVGNVAPCGIPLSDVRLDGRYMHWIGSAEKSEQVQAFCSCVEFFDTALFRKLGGFDDRFLFDYFELDFCIRAKQHGAIACTAPLPGTIHLAGGPRPLGADNFIMRDALLLRRKWHMSS